jgi:hypothetical protein
MAKLRKVTADATLLSAALEGLLLQRGRLDEQIREVRAMLGRRAPGKPAAAAAEAETAAAPAKKRKRRKMSAEARKRIAEAQKKRWAAFRKAQG